VAEETMNFVHNARDILLKAWSMKFWAASIAFGAIELAVPFLDGKVAPKTFAVLSIMAGICGMVARLLQQLGLSELPKDQDGSG
jgi:hypothetical protein